MPDRAIGAVQCIICCRNPVLGFCMVLENSACHLRATILLAREVASVHLHMLISSVLETSKRQIIASVTVRLAGSSSLWV